MNVWVYVWVKWFRGTHVFIPMNKQKKTTQEEQEAVKNDPLIGLNQNNAWLLYTSMEEDTHRDNERQREIERVRERQQV